MSEEDRNGLVDRVKAILLTPKEEWPKIEAEPATIGSIMTGWVVPLAAIGPVAGFIGGQLFGFGAFGFSFKPSLMGGLSMALTSYVMALVGTFVFALIIDALAPTFGGTKNNVQAMKVAAYGATAGMVGGIFGLIPSLGMLGLLAGLYSLYLLYLGLPQLMKAPEDKAVAYTAVAVVCAIVLGLVAGAVSRAVMPSPVSSYSESGGTVTMPGGGTIDTDRMKAAAERMEARAQGVETRSATLQSATPVEAAKLQALLPASLGSLARTSIESERMNAGIMGASTAKARYENGDEHLRLSITDMAGAGAIAAMGAAFGVERTKQTADGYEKTGIVNGRMTIEEWKGPNRRAKFGIIYGDRFLVEAEGEVASIDVVKAAVASVDGQALEAMAR